MNPKVAGFIYEFYANLLTRLFCVGGRHHYMAATLLHDPAAFGNRAQGDDSGLYRAWVFVSTAVRTETRALFSLSSALTGSPSDGSIASSTVGTTTVGGGGAGRSRGAQMDSSLSPQQQLEVLVTDHLDSVYRVAYSVVRDNALAEDVAQDAILKAWNALPTFRGDSSLRSWLLRITHNTAISTLRRRREELRDPDLLPERETRSSTEHQVIDRMSMGAFEEALNELDELSRSIVVLRELEGLSYDEISELLEVPLPTVKTRLLRARRVLASALSDWRS